MIKIRPKYYELEGTTAVPLEEGKLPSWRIAEYRVAFTENVLPGVNVSTVFLPIDHNFSEEGPPLVFETLVFGGNLDGETERYSDWTSAVKGHERMVGRVQGRVEPEAEEGEAFDAV